MTYNYLSCRFWIFRHNLAAQLRAFSSWKAINRLYGLWHAAWCGGDEVHTPILHWPSLRLAYNATYAEGPWLSLLCRCRYKFFHYSLSTLYCLRPLTDCLVYREFGKNINHTDYLLLHVWMVSRVETTIWETQLEDTHQLSTGQFLTIQIKDVPCEFGNTFNPTALEEHRENITPIPMHVLFANVA